MSKELLAAAEAGLRKVTNWKWDTEMEKTPQAIEHKARFVSGGADGWTFVISDFEVEGVRRCDGGATFIPGGIVLHLTPELATLGMELALKAPAA